MNVRELLVIIQRRLVRKAKQAEQAYINEKSVKITLNCVNHGRMLSDSTYHCKINAMGSHEEGASQCWNQKARICPVFERERDDEQLRRDFRKMRPNELAVRWPSIGELIRFQELLLQTDELKVKSDEKEIESGVRLLGDDRLQSSEEEGVSTNSGHVHRKLGTHGSGDTTSSSKDGIDEGRKSDERSTKSNTDLS